jgi:tRNA U55 pseudouridine synthase TruB
VTLDQARRTAALIKAHDRATKIISIMEQSDKPYVYAELSCRDSPAADVEGNHPYNILAVPRDLAIKMLTALRADAIQEMQAYGVDV